MGQFESAPRDSRESATTRRQPADPAVGIAPRQQRIAQLSSLLDGSARVGQLMALQTQFDSGVGGPAARANRTGLPDGLKAGIESLSGLSLDSVRVHRGSAEPAQLQARAFARGTDIHLGPGQEASLPHEAWHVVQQMQGRVRPTMTAGGAAINDDPHLEREADRMGAIAQRQPARTTAPGGSAVISGSGSVQLDRDGGRRVAPARPIAMAYAPVVQRDLDPAGLAELARLKALPAGHDEAARKAAAALYRSNPSSAQRDEIGLLVTKFSKEPVGKAPKGADKGADKAPKDDWAWSDKQIKVAGALSTASQKLFGLAQHIAVRQQRSWLQIDPREMPEPNITGFNSVVLKTYWPGQSPREWVNLHRALSQVASHSNELHVINFFAHANSAPIRVVISTHAHEGRPDYLVHDVHAKLNLEHGSVMTARDAPAEHHVSYAAFVKKIAAIKARDKVSDAGIAVVMQAMIRNPGHLPPYLVPRDSLQTFTELVATWMLAESIRHRSAMISGMRELQLIASGQRTFEQALGTDDAGGTHPMSQGASLKQGRIAEEEEREISKSGAPKKPVTKVSKKQAEQFDGDVHELLRLLFDTYIPEVNRVKTMAEVEAELMKKH